MISEKDRELAWSYVHGELPIPEAAAFKRRLSEDSDLEEEVDHIEGLDRELRSAMPFVRGHDRDKAVDRLIEAWDADQERDRVVTKPGGGNGEGSRSIVPFVTAGALAIAACLLVALGLLSRSAGTVYWKPVDFGMAPAVRAESPDVPSSRYTKSEMEAFAADVRGAVEAGLDESTLAVGRRGLFGGRPQWALGMKIQELFDGALMIEVAAYDDESVSPRRRWTVSYATEQEFRLGVQHWGSGVAEEFRRLTRKRPGGVEDADSR